MEPLKTHITLNPGRYSTYSLLRTEVLSYIEKVSQEKLVGSSGASPMEVDALSHGAGKPKGKGKKGKGKDGDAKSREKPQGQAPIPGHEFEFPRRVFQLRQGRTPIHGLLVRRRRRKRLKHAEKLEGEKGQRQRQRKGNGRKRAR